MQNVRIVAITTEVAEQVRTTQRLRFTASQLTWRSPKTVHPAATACAPSRQKTAGFFSPTIALPARSHFRSLALFTSMPTPASVMAKMALSRGTAEQPRTVEAYANGRKLKAQAHVADGHFEPVIENMFADRGVDYLQINSTTAGCFTFRIERT